MCRDLSRFFVAYRPRRLDATGAFCLCRGIKFLTLLTPIVDLAGVFERAVFCADAEVGAGVFCGLDLSRGELSMARTQGEAYKVIAATRPQGDYRGAVVGCGRMGSTIDDEHIHMAHYPWPWAHAPAATRPKKPGWNSIWPSARRSRPQKQEPTRFRLPSVAPQLPQVSTIVC